MFVLTLILILFDLIIYISDNVSYVQNLNFYSIFNLYGTPDALDFVRGVILIAILTFSAVFLFLEIRGAIYMRQVITKIIESDTKNI